MGNLLGLISGGSWGRPSLIVYGSLFWETGCERGWWIAGWQVAQENQVNCWLIILNNEQGVMKNKIYNGAWIVATNKVLSQFNLDQPVFDPFEATIIAGRAGELFSAIRSLGFVNGQRLDAYRKIYKLKRSVAIDVFRKAEKIGAVEVAWKTSEGYDEIDGAKFLIDSKDEVYKLTNSLFDSLHPTKIEMAVLYILSLTIFTPRTVREIKAKLIESGLSEEEAGNAVKLSTSLKLNNITKETERGSCILFNPHSFAGNVEDAFDAINGLDGEKRQKSLDILEFVKSNPGVPLPSSFDIDIVKLLIKVGMIDYSKITTVRGGTNRYFPTAPQLWGVFSRYSGCELSEDLIDDSKLLLNSFRYGQYFSSSNVGKIKDPSWIVNALLRDGAIGTVTPATAIGTDYPLALSRGIVNIVESRIHPGRYSMELMKVDVAEAVRDVLDKNAILPAHESPSPKDLERAGQFYVSPDAVRVETGLPDELKACQEEIIFGLRTMRRDR